MYRRLDDFRAHFQEEADDTLKVLRAIPDSAAAQAVAPAHRDLRRLAWHLVETLVMLPPMFGLRVDGPAEMLPVPDSMQEITNSYARAAAAVLRALDAWSEADLEKKDTLFGHLVWTRGYSLQALEMHQAHHRGQMTVLLRQAGLKVPEFYGPVLESYAAMGMAAPAI